MIRLRGVRPAILVTHVRAVVLREAAPGVHGEELVLVGPFRGREEMGAVEDDGTADGTAVLPAPKVRASLLEHGLRRERLVAEVREPRARELIGARPGHDAEHAAGGETELGLVRGLRHLELADGIHREILTRLAHLCPRVVHAVHDEAVRVLACAGSDVHVAPVEEPADVVLRDAGRQHRQVHPAPGRDREVLNLRIGHAGRYSGRAHVYERRLASDGDRLGQRGGSQREINSDGLVDDENQFGPALDIEPLKLRSEGVCAWR